MALNNQFYSGSMLNFAMGAATSRPGERLEAVVRQADVAMYAAKRAYYSGFGADRRESPILPAPRGLAPVSPFSESTPKGRESRSCSSGDAHASTGVLESQVTASVSGAANGLDERAKRLARSAAVDL